MHRWSNILIAFGGLGWATLSLGCGGGPRVAAGPTAVASARVPGPAHLDSTFVLESGGAQPEDTTVAIAAGSARVIIVRRGAPDNGLFARLAIPAGGTSGGDSVRLTLRPRPGRYGIDIEVDGQLAAGAELTMSYAVHFIAPQGARAHFGSDLGFEKALYLAMELPDGRLAFLPTTRPGSDLVTAILPGPGRYLVAAPRS
jgi:hypothetical protein